MNSSIDCHVSYKNKTCYSCVNFDGLPNTTRTSPILMQSKSLGMNILTPKTYNIIIILKNQNLNPKFQTSKP